jgi:hypothetical protein
MAKQDYRDNAVACLRLAKEATNASARAALFRIAETWLRLHEQAEKNAELDLTYETPPPRQSVPQQQQQQQQRSKSKE